MWGTKPRWNKQETKIKVHLSATISINTLNVDGLEDRDSENG